ncbi:MAG TPA: hypothetical protein VMT17_00880 [Anaeromyxobacteraceae bacterium]|nr:hypothetical protein [Anaeromyxobacteraceae bacterium]
MTRARPVPIAWRLAWSVAAACAAHPYYYRGGEVDCRVREAGDDEFSVSATGSNSTPFEALDEVALLHAAHVAIAHGRTHFVVQAQVDAGRTTEDVVTVGSPTLFLLPVGVSHGWVPFRVLLFRILPLDEPPPPEAVDANRTVRTLAPKYEPGGEAASAVGPAND